MLRDRFNNGRKLYTKDMEEMYRHYLGELRRVEEMRADGVTGYLDFEAWD